MREYLDGNAAIVRGALAAGCTFFAGYPITPASGILMAMMAELPRRGGIAIQGEDEIASIGMCIGAAMTGARAMTATSGPGISLYSESIGLAVMGEVPLVIVDVQRLGPATGGATSVGSGDVQFVRWGTSGGYPIIALAPASVAECYTLTARAFDLAERFRCPVFVLTDKEIAMTLATVEASAFGPVAVRERELVASGTPYRYEPAGDVPPLHRYGLGDTIRFTGSTHDEGAVITKDPPTVAALNHHLAAKIEEHLDELELVRRGSAARRPHPGGLLRRHHGGGPRRGRAGAGRRPGGLAPRHPEPVAGAGGRHRCRDGGRRSGRGAGAQPGPVSA